ncbi:MAG: addiction module protein [Flavobacteriaceae bacterium]|nr:addiction module protein [Flavobacteriaceae bacterium]
MDLQLTKLELIEMLLNTKKAAVLQKVKLILETEQDNLSLTEAHYQVLDERRTAYLKGEGASLSWEEVKEKALKALS